MKANVFLGIDNGVTGSIGIIINDMVTYVPMPVFRQLNYTKSKQWLHRIDGVMLKTFLEDLSKENCFCLIERPMLNPGRWKATVSAIRAVEATQTILELLQIPYQFVDSKEWQSVMLPSGLEKEELKEASLNVGKRLFPQMDWIKFKDADGLLMAEFARRRMK